MKIYDFMAKRKACGIGSALLVIASLIYIAKPGIQFNVDFAGGTKLTVVFNNSQVDIGTLRSQVTKVDPKATIVQEQTDSGSRFSLKIKNPDVEEGKESEVSLARRRGLEKAFAAIGNEDQALLDKLAGTDGAVLAEKMLAENIYGMVDTDAKKTATYKDLAEKIKAGVAGATNIDELAASQDPQNADKLSVGLVSNIFPALNHATKDALNATLKKYNPLKRTGEADYSDVVAHIESVKVNDFISSFDDLTFEGVAVDGAVMKDFIGDNFVLSNYKIVANETFSPSIAAELLENAEGAVLLALFFILIYIAFRFDSNYAVASVVALAHDVTIALGVFALAGTLWGVELSNPVVAAFLTIVGYSLNDTIVVFDRIRDNRADIKNPDLKKIMNTSINQTLSRTLVTSLTTFFVVAIIYWGSNNTTLRDFAFPLLIGIIVGTYSSIFVASPVLLFMTDNKVMEKFWAAVGAFFRVITFSGKAPAGKSARRT